MIGFGTLLNAGGIVVGGLAGLLFGKRLGVRQQSILLQAVGACVIFLGIAGAMEKMLTISNGALESGGTMMLIGTMATGALLGEWLNIEGRVEKFGCWLRAKTGNGGDTHFVDGFVNASLTVCIGAMAVVGALQDGISGDCSILAAKAVLDLIIILVMTVAQGKGCIFSAIPVAIFQGGITLLARVIQPLMTPQALLNLSLTGSVMIFCVGVNLIWDKKFRVANFLPAVILAVVWAFFPF